LKESFNPYNNFGYLTARISRLIHERAKSKLISLGYPIPTSCLGILADLIHENGATQKQLGSSLVKTKSSINKMLSVLESYQLVEKLSDPKDARSNLIYITKAGEELFYKLAEKDLEFTNHLIHKYGKKTVLDTKAQLNRVYETLLEQSRN